MIFSNAGLYHGERGLIRRAAPLSMPKRGGHFLLFKICIVYQFLTEDDIVSDIANKNLILLTILVISLVKWQSSWILRHVLLQFLICDSLLLKLNLIYLSFKVIHSLKMFVFNNTPETVMS